MHGELFMSDSSYCWTTEEEFEFFQREKDIDKKIEEMVKKDVRTASNSSYM